jgi:hypothetical protein
MGSPSVSAAAMVLGEKCWRRSRLGTRKPRAREILLLLDRVVEVTGYARKYAIQLLNSVPQSATRILRPRQSIYGSAVQEALFLAWRTIQYPCAKRLVPSLPELIPLLERNGHLQLNEEQRRKVLTMSVRTAERLLSTQRRPTPLMASQPRSREPCSSIRSPFALLLSGTRIGLALWRRIWRIASRKILPRSQKTRTFSDSWVRSFVMQCVPISW